MATQKGRNWSSGDIVTAANLGSIERGVSAVSSLYEPTTWANGDTVTAAALNNIEQGIVNADGGGKSWVTLCEEEVTIEEHNDVYGALLSYSQLISADTIRVTFDGTEYMCENTSPEEETYAYGGIGETGPDFSEYPFALVSSGLDPIENEIYTETSGTHTVKIEVLQESGSSDFSTAQVTVVANGIVWHSTMPFVYEEGAMGGSSPAMICTVPSATSKNASSLIALYKGSAFINFTATSGSVVVTGNGMNLGNDTLLITGDCTITISDSSGELTQ